MENDNSNEINWDQSAKQHDNGDQRYTTQSLVQNQMVEPGNRKRSQNHLPPNNNNDYRSTKENGPNTNSLPILYHRQEYTRPTVPTIARKDETATRPSGLCQYCPGQPPLEQPSYTSIHIYLGHTKPFPEIMSEMSKWLMDEQIQISLTPIQEEKVQEICWLIYTTRNLNCKDLAWAISAAIRIPTAAHFKQISLGRKQGTKASAIHLMVANQHMQDAMNWLKQIYVKNRITESATKFPLGQRLLLAPLASK